MVSLKGFTYRIGFNRDFNITEKVILNVELASGGNTGIYDYPPENLAFVQGQVKGSIDFKNNISLKPEVSYQRNIGRKDGIASRSDNEWIIGAWIVWTF